MIQNNPLTWPTGWPRTPRPVESRFGDWNKKPSIYEASEKVKHEIKLLHGSEIIISSNLKYKIDGTPYSNQREPDDKGIAVYFILKGTQMVIACDNYNKIGCNLWAIAKTIEAMRGIDRWGCSEIMNRAFTGFKAIGYSEPQKKSCWEILGVRENATQQEIDTAFRLLAHKYHPDTGGENADIDKFNDVVLSRYTALKNSTNVNVHLLKGKGKP